MEKRTKRCIARGRHQGRNWRCDRNAGPKYDLCPGHLAQWQRGKDRFVPIRDPNAGRKRVQAMIERSLKEDAG